jgi:hypothetical protein
MVSLFGQVRLERRRRRSRMIGNNLRLGHSRRKTWVRHRRFRKMPAGLETIEVTSNLVGESASHRAASPGA